MYEDCNRSSLLEFEPTAIVYHLRKVTFKLPHPTFIGLICSHDDLVPVVFCEIHYHLFVLQKHLKETQKTFQQRIQQREKDLQQLREMVESHKVSLDKKISLSQSHFRLTES